MNTHSTPAWQTQTALTYTVEHLKHGATGAWFLLATTPRGTRNAIAKFEDDISSPAREDVLRACNSHAAFVTLAEYADEQLSRNLTGAEAGRVLKSLVDQARTALAAAKGEAK